MLVLEMSEAGFSLSWVAPRIAVVNSVRPIWDECCFCFDPSRFVFVATLRHSMPSARIGEGVKEKICFTLFFIHLEE
jgi:hypothetical protein